MKFSSLAFLTFVTCGAITIIGCDGDGLSVADSETVTIAGRTAAAVATPGITINATVREYNARRYAFRYTSTIQEALYSVKVFYQTGDFSTKVFIKDLPIPLLNTESVFYLGASELAALPSTSNGEIKIVIQAMALLINGNQRFYPPASTTIYRARSSSNDGSGSFYNNGRGIFIYPNSALLPGEFVIFPKMWNGTQVAAHDYKLIMQGDGNLVVYDEAGRVYGRTGTSGQPGLMLHFVSDGNLYLVSADGVRKRLLGSGGMYGAALVFQSDNNLVLYRGNRSVAWSIR